MPVFLHVREASLRAGCLSHLRSLSKAIDLYTANNSGRLPLSMLADADRWHPSREATERDLEYWANAIDMQEGDTACPTIDAAIAFAYNGYLHAYKTADVVDHARVISFWEGFGKRPRNVSLPRLNCQSITDPCVASDLSIATIAEPPTGTAWSHGRGANFLFLDGHAAWRRLGGKAGVPTNQSVDPFHEYDSAGRVDRFWLDKDGRAPLFMP
jgi:prepilin-type processing-associated H-X9-DG protein